MNVEDGGPAMKEANADQISADLRLVCKDGPRFEPGELF